MTGNLDTYSLHSVFRSGSQWQVLVDPGGTILELSGALLEFTGQPRDALVQTSLIALLERHLAQAALDTLKGALLEAASGAPVEARLELRDKTTLRVLVKPVFTDADVTALLVTLEPEAAQPGSLQRNALSELPVGVLKWEAEGSLSLYNRAAQRMLGLSREQLTGLTPPNPHLSISYDDGTPFFEDSWPHHLHSDFDEPPLNILLKVERPLRDTRWLLMTTEVTEQDDETRSYATLTTLTDITEQRKLSESLRQGALYDPLTSLPMQSLFAERLTQVIGKAKRVPRYCFAVLLIGLDDVGAVSGAAGQRGDALVQVATQLKESLRTADTLARLSEDEFVILLDDAVVLADAVEVAERSLTLLSECDVSGKALGASIGILIGDKTCSDPYQVLNQTRQAMLEAKSQDRGRYAIYR